MTKIIIFNRLNKYNIINTKKIDKDNFYKKWKILIKFAVKLNKNYKNCEIYRRRFKNLENLENLCEDFLFFKSILLLDITI